MIVWFYINEIQKHPAWKAFVDFYRMYYDWRANQSSYDWRSTYNGWYTHWVAFKTGYDCDKYGNNRIENNQKVNDG